MIAAVGLANLQFVDLNSSRNLFIIGFSLFFGLALPKYLRSDIGANSIKTGTVITVIYVSQCPLSHTNIKNLSFMVRCAHWFEG